MIYFLQFVRIETIEILFWYNNHKKKANQEYGNQYGKHATDEKGL